MRPPLQGIQHTACLLSTHPLLLHAREQGQQHKHTCLGQQSGRALDTYAPGTEGEKVLDTLGKTSRPSESACQVPILT